MNNIKKALVIVFFSMVSLAGLEAKVKVKAKIRQIASTLAEGVGIDYSKNKVGKKNLTIYYQRHTGLIPAAGRYLPQLLLQAAIAGVLLKETGFLSDNNIVSDIYRQIYHVPTSSISLSSSSSSSSSFEGPISSSFTLKDRIQRASGIVYAAVREQNTRHLLMLGATALSTVAVAASLYGLLKMWGSWEKCPWVVLDGFGITYSSTRQFLRWDQITSITLSNNNQTLTLVGKDQDLVFERLEMPMSIESFLGCLEIFIKQHVAKAVSY